MWHMSMLWVNTVPFSERNSSSVNDTAASTTTQTVLCTGVLTKSSCTSDIKAGRWLCRSGKESRLVLPRLRGGGWASVRAGRVGGVQNHATILHTCDLLYDPVRNTEQWVNHNFKNRVLKKSGQLQRSQQTKTKIFVNGYRGMFARGKRNQDVELITHLHAVPRLRTSGVTNPPPIRLQIAHSENFTAHFNIF